MIKNAESRFVGEMGVKGDDWLYGDTFSIAASQNVRLMPVTTVFYAHQLKTGADI